MREQDCETGTVLASPRAGLSLFCPIVLIAIAGTYGDYTAGPEIWTPGPTWHPLGTLFVWPGSGLIALVVYHLLVRRPAETSSERRSTAQEEINP